MIRLWELGSAVYCVVNINIYIIFFKHLFAICIIINLTIGQWSHFTSRRVERFSSITSKLPKNYSIRPFKTTAVVFIIICFHFNGWNCRSETRLRWPFHAARDFRKDPPSGFGCARLPNGVYTTYHRAPTRNASTTRHGIARLLKDLTCQGVPPQSSLTGIEMQILNTGT